MPADERAGHPAFPRAGGVNVALLDPKTQRKENVLFN
jgi:hypothetical protein